MEFTLLGIGILTWITFLPVVGMVIVLLLPKNSKDAIRWTSLGITILQVILAVVIFSRFDRSLAGINSVAGMQFVEKGTWIDIPSVAWFGRVHIEYFLGIDGISVVMVILTALISFIATISSWKIDRSEKGYFALLLLLNTGMMGVFVALDFFLFYVFWEVMLLPMYFLIGVWGGPVHPVRQRADAARDDRALLQHERVHRCSRRDPLDRRRHQERPGRVGEDPYLQYHRHDGSGQYDAGLAPRRMGDHVALPRVYRPVHRLRDQGPALPVPHVVA